MVKIVITGSVCSGKTSVINELAKLGFNTIKEGAREIIIEETQKNNKGYLPWNTDKIGLFQDLVFKKQIEYENSLDENNIYFLDRGFCDILAFYLNYNINIPSNLINQIYSSTYDLIFFLEVVNQTIYKNDSERKESYQTAIKIQKIIYDIYQKTGFKTIFLPNDLDTQQRVQFILKILTSNNILKNNLLIPKI